MTPKKESTKNLERIQITLHTNIVPFVKTMKKVREKTNHEFKSFTQTDQRLKEQSKLNLKGIVNNNSTVSVHKLDKENTFFDKPFLGFSVL